MSGTSIIAQFSMPLNKPRYVYIGFYRAPRGYPDIGQ